VAVALRLLIPSEPYKPATTERSRAGSARRALIEIAGYAVVLASVALAIEIRSAYGSPFGERSLPTVEVVDVGECERAPLGFGISRSCELTSFRSSDPEHHPTQRMDSIEVVTAEPVEPGDLVAQYSASAWTAYAFLGSTDSRWRPVSAEERPNLDWLPTATLIAATFSLRRFGNESCWLQSKKCASFWTLPPVEVIPTGDLPPSTALVGRGPLWIPIALRGETSPVRAT
jgi:hypothetical protein